MQISDPDSLYPALVAWFDANGRDLPWRHTNEPWAILVCEVMSQQTPIARVLPAWNAWMKRWPTPQALAAAAPADVLVAWDRLGYPRRALRLQECAQVVTERYDGVVPSERERLLALPGVGPYTADAVLAFAFTKRSVVLDTNIRRVLARWHGEALPAPSQSKAEVERADRFVPAQPERAAKWNMAIMELGALVCTARSPQCASCPMLAACGWYQAGQPEDPHAAKRSTQAWHGTNRQARGAIMGLLRAHHSIDRAALSTLDLEPSRIETALAGLISDGLVVESESRLSLPGRIDA